MKNAIKGGVILLSIALITYIMRNIAKELDDVFDVGGIDFADVDHVEYDK